MTEKPALICVRLADMMRVHPDQITDVCDKCGTEVGIYPSGQRVIKSVGGRQHIEIICAVCYGPATAGILAPGAEFEPMQSKPRDEK